MKIIASCSSVFKYGIQCTNLLAVVDAGQNHIYDTVNYVPAADRDAYLVRSPIYIQITRLLSTLYLPYPESIACDDMYAALRTKGHYHPLITEL